MKIQVTTSLAMNEQVVQRAQQIARQLNVAYVERQKKSIGQLLKETSFLVVVYKEKMVVESASGSFFFHPDTAILRIKASRDPLLDLVGSPRQRILDCTMGLATDSLVLASAGHSVTALESSALIHLIVSQGLAQTDCRHARIQSAMQSLRTICTDSLSFLRRAETHSYDVVYFDPMFVEAIPESQNLAGLTPLANNQGLSEDLLQEAKRVARKKIILKGHFRDTSFERLGFKRLVRPNQKFHYGEMVLTPCGKEANEDISHSF